MASFWDVAGPGLIEGGANYWLNQRNQKQAEDRLRRAQGPLYDQSLGLAGTSLNLAKGMDPQAFAAERFKAQQALVAPGQAAAQQELMRQLQARGMLDVASFSPVAGTTATPGVSMNPQFAALYAAQAGANSKSAYDSLAEGQAYLDSLIKRSGMLQGQAQLSRSTGQKAMEAIPRKPSLADSALRTISRPGVATSIFKGIQELPGLFNQGVDWWKNLGSTPEIDPYKYNEDLWGK